MADPAPYYSAHVFACVNERPEGHPRGCCKRKGAEKRKVAKGKSAAFAPLR